MEFHTKVHIDKLKNRLDHTHRGLSLGSCFAENIAVKMRRAKFKLESNPFGVLYNPTSIAESLKMLSDNSFEVAEKDILKCGEVWCNFHFHGSLSYTDKKIALDNMNNAINSGRDAMEKSDYVIITFGTSWIYEHNGNVVANCHKFPASTFKRRRLRVDEIIECYSEIIETILKNKQVIFTVSPIRHIKDGLVENNVSKASLILAIAELVDKYPNVYYFPSFEIVNDELRDYRFYKSDMLHPSDVAIEYIWELFCSSVFSEDSVKVIRESEKIVSAMEHRPFNPQSESHKTFVESMRRKIEVLQNKYPLLDWSEELDFFKV